MSKRTDELEAMISAAIDDWSKKHKDPMMSEILGALEVIRSDLFEAFVKTSEAVLPSRATTVFRWERLPHTPTQGLFCDVPGGRLLVRRARKGSQSFLGHWNGVRVKGQRLQQTLAQTKHMMEVQYINGELR